MICTFYSYKGGVGRSMAMANVADILSRRGLKVLMIDFDLEAPGLEQYFYRGDERESRDAVRGQPGLLDLLLAYKEAMSVTGGGDDFRDVGRYIASIFARRPNGGRLDLLPAGQRLSAEQLARYALALRSFDWQDFYFNWEGDLFFEWLRRALDGKGYDLVLIDSRTGVTEMGGICGYQLADVIVMMCGANHQNVDGTWSMLEDFRSQPVEGLRRGRPLEIVVVPARVEQRAPALLSEFFERFDRRFAALLPQRLAALGLRFRDLTIPYDPQFAFEERVARDPEEMAAREHLANIFSQLADVISALAPLDTPPEHALAGLARHARARLQAAPGTVPAEADGASAQARYDETKRFAEFDVLLSYARQDAALVSQLRRALAERGVRAAVDAVEGAVGADWKQRMEGMLTHVRALAVCLGAGAFEAQQQRLVALALMARNAGRDVALLPVLLPGHVGEEPADRALAEFVCIDLRHGIERSALERLVEILHRPQRPFPRTMIPAAPKVEHEERCPYIGPGPFSEHHSDLFFGRADELRELQSQIEQASVVVVLGPSASGKTSLIRAGLFPALRKGHPDWKLIEADTVNRAGRAVALALPGASAELPDMRDAFEAIAARPRGSVVVAIDRLSRPAGGPLDADDAPAEFPPGAARGARTEAVVRALAERGARVLVSLRSDELEEWHKAVADSGLERAPVFELRPPGAGALREIIERPADRAGLAFEPGLVDRLMSRAENETGVLPFLQLTLVQLWDRRRNGWLTNAAYDALGGLRGVIVDTADRCFERHGPEAREAMRRVILRLLQVAPGGTRATAQRVRSATLSAPGSATATVTASLVEAGLVVVTRDREGAALELAHEALARDWPRVLVWLEQQRDFLEWLQRLRAEAESWRSAGQTDALLLHDAALDEAQRMCAQHGRDVGEDMLAYVAESAASRERLRTRRMRARTTLAAVFMLIAMAAATGWFTSVQKGSDLAEKQIALEAQRAALLDQLRQLEGERNTAEAQRVEAEARFDELKRTLDEALVSAREAPADQPMQVAAPIERAVVQAQEAIEQQQSYAKKRAIEIDRQQSAIRSILIRSIPKAAN